MKNENEKMKIKQKPEVQIQNSSSLPLTTTMVGLKNPNKSMKNPTLPPGLQNSS